MGLLLFLNILINIFHISIFVSNVTNIDKASINKNCFGLLNNFYKRIGVLRPTCLRITAKGTTQMFKVSSKTRTVIQG